MGCCQSLEDSATSRANARVRRFDAPPQTPSPRPVLLGDDTGLNSSMPADAYAAENECASDTDAAGAVIVVAAVSVAAMSPSEGAPPPATSAVVDAAAGSGAKGAADSPSAGAVVAAFPGQLPASRDEDPIIRDHSMMTSLRTFMEHVETTQQQQQMHQQQAAAQLVIHQRSPRRSTLSLQSNSATSGVLRDVAPDFVVPRSREGSFLCGDSAGPADLGATQGPGHMFAQSAHGSSHPNARSMSDSVDPILPHGVVAPNFAAAAVDDGAPRSPGNKSGSGSTRPHED